MQEEAQLDSGLFGLAEGQVAAGAQWLRLAVESAGALFVAAGIIVGLIAFAQATARGEADAYTQVRLRLARFLAIALEFQLGADILSTAIAPGWQEIGKLAAIAVIRTGLNYFLGQEMEREAARIAAARTVVPS